AFVPRLRRTGRHAGARPAIDDRLARAGRIAGVVGRGIEAATNEFPRRTSRDVLCSPDCKRWRGGGVEGGGLWVLAFPGHWRFSSASSSFPAVCVNAICKYIACWDASTSDVSPSPRRLRLWWPSLCPS